MVRMTNAVMSNATATVRHIRKAIERSRNRTIVEPHFEPDAETMP
jgi:hypothetical protein